jgi:hypothetical protein
MAVIWAVVKYPATIFAPDLSQETFARFKFGVSGLKWLSSLPISHGFEDLGAVGMAVARTNNASGLKGKRTNRLQELGGEHHLDFAVGCRRLVAIRLTLVFEQRFEARSHHLLMLWPDSVEQACSPHRSQQAIRANHQSTGVLTNLRVSNPPAPVLSVRRCNSSPENTRGTTSAVSFS